MIICYFYKDGELKETNVWTKIKKILKDLSQISYIDILKPSNEELENLRQLLDLHPITIENCMSGKENSKIEEYENYTATLLQDLKAYNKKDKFKIIPINIILTSNSVISIRKESTETFEKIFVKISEKDNSIFDNTSTLYYMILDTLVENYFPLLALWGGKLDALEGKLLKKDSNIVEEVMHIRKEILKLKNIFIYEQEVMYKLSHEDMNLVSKEQRLYIKDVFHHLDRLNTTLDEYKYWAIQLMDEYSAYSSAKLNDNMQVLTTISFIFMPLGFITGWYGMGFKMPEMEWKYGYEYIVVLTIIVSISLIIYFKKKRFF